jgi:hypothetical protein
MPRTQLSLEISDLSAFAKSLRDQIAGLEKKPGHVETLNIVSRAAGFRNFQHFRTTTDRSENSDSWKPAPFVTPVVDEARVMKTMRVFSRDGLLIRWPGKRAQQELCLWFLWSKLPRGKQFGEREIGELLNTLHTFGDAALLRRDLFDLGLVTRKKDGSDYRRVERKPPPELQLLLRRLEAVMAAA